MRRWEEALGSYEDAIRLAPDWVSPYVQRGWIAVRGQGDVEAARREADRWTRLGDPDEPTHLQLRREIHLYERDWDGALELTERFPGPLVEDQNLTVPKAWYRGEVLWLAGRQAEARDAFREALSALEPRLGGAPDHWVLSSAALVYAGLGREAQAWEAMARAWEELPLEKDRFAAPSTLEAEVQVHVLLGGTDAALTALERLAPLGYSQPMTAHRLRLDPRFDALRDEPRFRALLTRE